MTEQWQLDGDCEVCRKKAYCRKSCSAHKTAIKKYIASTLKDKYGIDEGKVESMFNIDKMLKAIKEGGVSEGNRLQEEREPSEVPLGE